MRYEFRVTKYDPRFREERGHCTRDEWTHFSQVGRRVGGRVLTMSAYLAVEEKYLTVLEAMLREAGVEELEVRDLWAPNAMARWRRRSLVTVRQARSFARMALREEVGGKLVAPWRAYVHFGWDYYLYVGLSRPVPCALNLA